MALLCTVMTNQHYLYVKTSATAEKYMSLQSILIIMKGKKIEHDIVIDKQILINI